RPHLRAGEAPRLAPGANHNQTLARAPRPPAGLKVKTHIKAGEAPRPGLMQNHNQTLVRTPSPRPPGGLRVKTHVKAGALPQAPLPGILINHNQTLVQASRPPGGKAQPHGQAWGSPVETPHTQTLARPRGLHIK